jgi:hypothetical protein
MPPYAILTNRKRAIIALIHSVAFLFIALRSVLVPSPTRGIFSLFHIHARIAGPLAITTIFLIVSAILVTLFHYSGNTREKLYFGFCSVSASTGLLRCLIGDPPFHSANYLRSSMLMCAVVVGTLIWLGYSEPQLSSD